MFVFEGLDIAKVTGLLLILISSSFAGMYFAAREKTRIKDLDELKKSLSIWISEISFSSSALPAAFKNVSKYSGERVSPLFDEAARLLGSKAGAEEAWISACDGFGGTALAKEDKDKLKILASALTGFDKNLLVKNIGLAIDYIDDKKTLLNGEAEKNGKLFRSLGVLGGLLIIVIFI